MLSIIVAVANNNVIGFNNKMPWHIPEDLKYFKEKTMGKTVIMGRKTLESIGKPLKGRKNVIMTKNKDYLSKFDDVKIVHDFSEIIPYIDDEDENFIIGGAEVYKELLPFSEYLYITRIYKDFQGDKYFEDIDEEEWILINKSSPQKNSDFEYEVLIYKRIK